KKQLNVSLPNYKKAGEGKFNWDIETLIIFLYDLDLNLDEDDFKILRKQKIDGQIFPDMTEKKFMKNDIKRIWSIQHLISWSTNIFGPTEKNEAHTVFYNTLYNFCNDPIASQEILEVVRNFLLNKKVSRKKGHKPLADTSNLQKEIIEKLASSNISKVLDASADISLRSDRTIDILEILKTIIHNFDQVCDNGDYHHLYCDLTIKKPNSPYLEALLELLAMASIPKLESHFKQVFKYEEQLHH
ncbi:10775_t:CDS:2, partial [Cetraspora pellucida]